MSSTFAFSDRPTLPLVRRPQMACLDLAFSVHRPGRVRVQVLASAQAPLLPAHGDCLTIPCGDGAIALVTLDPPD